VTTQRQAIAALLEDLVTETCLACGHMERAFPDTDAWAGRLLSLVEQDPRLAVIRDYCAQAQARLPEGYSLTWAREIEAVASQERGA
jgi:hypothetical protein